MCAVRLMSRFVYFLQNISLHFFKYLFSGHLLTNYLVEYFSMRRFIPLLIKLKIAAKDNAALVRSALNKQICLLFAKYFFIFLEIIFSGDLLTNHFVEDFSISKFISFLIKLRSASKDNHCQPALVRRALNEQICLLLVKYFFIFLLIFLHYEEICLQTICVEIYSTSQHIFLDSWTFS